MQNTRRSSSASEATEETTSLKQRRTTPLHRARAGGGRGEGNDRSTRGCTRRQRRRGGGRDGGGGLHLALNSGHDGWFPDVIQWSCAAPTRRLMKTHASNGASQMIPTPCIRSACRRVRFRSIVHVNGVPGTARGRSASPRRKSARRKLARALPNP